VWFSTITEYSGASKSPTSHKRSSLLHWCLTAGASLAVICGIGAIYLVRNWPFTREAVTVALQDRFARTVEIRSFRNTYFPPGFVAEGVSFLHREHKNLPPLITVQTLALRGSFVGLLSIHKYVAYVQVIGLHVLVPPADTTGKAHGVMPLTDSSSNSLTIGEIQTDGAVLEFMSSRHDKEPYKLEIQHLTLDNVGQRGPMRFRVTLHNTEPPGEIGSTGQFGPWDAEDPGSTPVSGTYTFENANLGIFQGIAGTLGSHGKFTGTLGRLESDGGVDIPNFHVSGSSHTVHMSTEFHAAVNATDGDTSLQNVQSHFQRTTVLSQGGVTGHVGQHGKTAVLEMTVRDGRVDDLLFLFTGDQRPSMTGSVNLHAHVELPPGPPGFLEKLKMEGDFGVGGGRFTNANVQMPVNRLTESAQGKNKKQEVDDPQTVVSNLKGHVSVKGGIATLSDVSFAAPGTLAEIRGTFNLVSKALNLQGVLRTNGKLSDTTSGFKSIVIKALSPFLKKRSITVVPFTITGTAGNPSFALDLDGKRKL
jgi:AsmA-like protein